MQCSDVMIHMGGIEPESCDHVFDAQYCIKSTSLEGTFLNDNLQKYFQINVHALSISSWFLPIDYFLHVGSI